MAQYTQEELQAIGFKSLGQHVAIDRTVQFFGARFIEIGDHTRIDAYSVLSGSAEGLHIGQHVHISCHVTILGQGRVEVQDFAGLSSKVSIFSSNDDYSGEALTGPTVDEVFRNVHTDQVIVGRHVVVGAGSVLLPGVTLGQGSAVGALSLVRRDVEPFVIVVGQPAKPVSKRSETLLELEAKFLAKRDAK